MQLLVCYYGGTPTPITNTAPHPPSLPTPLSHESIEQMSQIHNQVVLIHMILKQVTG